MTVKKILSICALLLSPSLAVTTTPPPGFSNQGNSQSAKCQRAIQQSINGKRCAAYSGSAYKQIVLCNDN